MWRFEIIAVVGRGAVVAVSPAVFRPREYAFRILFGPLRQLTAAVRLRWRRRGGVNRGVLYRRSSILSGRSRSQPRLSRRRYLFIFFFSVPRPLAVIPELDDFSPVPAVIMLNALSRAALGALKAGKSNLTPKIVQNELPKAMVATTSNCECIYTRVDGTFSTRPPGRFVGPTIFPSLRPENDL